MGSGKRRFLSFSIDIVIFSQMGLIYFQEDWKIKDAHTKWKKSFIPTDQELYPERERGM